MSDAIIGWDECGDGTPAPGSDEALARGCLCPTLDNHHGRGVPINAGGVKRMWWRVQDCPLHGWGARMETMSEEE